MIDIDNKLPGSSFQLNQALLAGDLPALFARQTAQACKDGEDSC